MSIDANGITLRRLVGGAVSLAWLGFWLVVARIHVMKGAPIDAGFTSLLAVAPAVGIVALILRDRTAATLDFPAEIPAVGP